jgi:hypothetical protein
MDFLDSTREHRVGPAGHALAIIMSPDRLIFLVFGVLVGLALGLVPGIGGLTGFALLVPFTYTMDPYAAFGMLLGHAFGHRHRRLGHVGAVRRAGAQFAGDRARRPADDQARRRARGR